MLFLLLAFDILYTCFARQRLHFKWLLRDMSCMPVATKLSIAINHSAILDFILNIVVLKHYKQLNCLSFITKSYIWQPRSKSFKRNIWISNNVFIACNWITQLLNCFANATFCVQLTSGMLCLVNSIMLMTFVFKTWSWTKD